MTDCLPVRSSFAFLRVIYFSYIFSRCLGLVDFSKLSVASFRCKGSLAAFFSVVVPFNIDNPKDHVVLYFRKSYTVSLLLLPVYWSKSSLVTFCSVSRNLF